MEINILQVLFQLVNFGVVFGALTYFLYKPILKILDERRKKVEQAQLTAEETTKEKEEIEVFKKKARLASEKDASKVMEKAQEDAKELKNRLSKEIRDEVKAIREKELAKVAEEVRGNKAQTEKHITETALAVASKILGKEVSDKKVQSSLINEAIKDLDSTLAGLK